MTKLNDKLNHILFSNKFYNFFMKPFDKILYPIVKSSKLIDSRKEQKAPYNKIANVSDLYNKEWERTMLNMEEFFFMDLDSFHRKIWEYIQIIYILKDSGYLYPKNKGLAIGAGREYILYYLAHKIKEIVGVDIYKGKYYGGEDNSLIPKNPYKFAPFLYPAEKLNLLTMDAGNLDFNKNSFDFIFSASSIEHFGSIENIIKSAREMYRVLKPGGGCAITTELKLNRLGSNIPNTKVFKLKTLVNIFKKAGFKININEEKINLEDQYLYNWVKLPEEINKRPHVILRFLNTVFTSFSFVCIKPGNTVKRGKWIEKFDYTPFKYKSEIKVSLNKKVFKKGENAPIKISLKNKSNFDWFTDGFSHRIAIGIKLMDSSGKFIDEEFSDIKIPKKIKSGDNLDFETKLNIDLESGKYKLFFGLKRELLTWFYEKGDKPFILDIEVT